MAGKRKRTRQGGGNGGDQKRQKVSNSQNGKEPVVKQALLNQYYHVVQTLREYLLFRLPTKSKVRRKKIVSLGRNAGDKEKDQKLARFLDQTLVGVSKETVASPEERWQQWTTFSQRADDSISFANLSGVGVYSQSEIIDFAIWLLFSKSHATQNKNQHLLCQGYRKDITFRALNQGENAGSSIPGVVSQYPNGHVTSMKAWPWPHILVLMGKEGEKGMVDLVIDCGIFLPVEGGRGTYHQLSGQPLGDLQVLPDPASVPVPPPKTNSLTVVTPRTPSSINFVRNRMLYARAALNAQCKVRFSLRHIHVLNRYPLLKARSEADEIDNTTIANFKPEYNTVHVMMYIFPRQFRLHNVFTSEVDSRQTVQPFKDYTLREDEIKKKYSQAKPPKVPKRLRGMAAYLVQKLQIRHSRCAYKKILEYYCPVPGKVSPPMLVEPLPSIDSSSKFKTQFTASTVPDVASTRSTTIQIPPRKPSMMDHATPTAMVSAFCRAVLSHLLPPQFWGMGETQIHNERVFHQNIDRFVGLRRFEGLSLHEVCQGLQISEIQWLHLPNTTNQKPSQSETLTRQHLLHEFLYYLIDSLLIPLLRSHFHITESSMHRYRLFYFRHDIWRSISEPSLSSLKLSLFEEIKPDLANKVLDGRVLGYSMVRLLPKESGVRPIMNLRRRMVKRGGKGGVLGSSINSVLAPVYNVLTYEKNLNPSKLGSTLFSISDLYLSLTTFKPLLPPSHPPLYFAKLDVQSAFDTIPQSSILSLISSLPTSSYYRISKYFFITTTPHTTNAQTTFTKPTKKWTALAHPPNDLTTFPQLLEYSLGMNKKNTVFVESIIPQFRDTSELLELLEQHVLQNIIKIGKKFYRQKTGIPQGSVLSSLLCNYFYADLEATHLSFLDPKESLLLRLIDDFLLITTNPSHAKRFLEIMHKGVPEYGVSCNPDKTLVNFEISINGKKVPRLVEKERGFPYCGSFINTSTLDISRDRERRKDGAIIDSLTVEYSRVPGKTFGRKVLNTFKIQSHAMFLDTSFNSMKTVIENVYTAFEETAEKMWMYVKCLPVGKRPGTKLVIQTIQSLISLAVVLTKSKGRIRKNAGYKCALTKGQVEFLALDAFRKVLGRRQSRYGGVLGWLDRRLVGLKGGC